MTKMTSATERFCTGNAVYLRPARGADADVVTEWKRDPHIRRMALDPGTEIHRQAEEDGILRALDSEGELYLIVALRETDEPVGYVRINWMDDDRKMAWLRFAIGRGRGKGLGKDSVGSLLGHLVENGLHRAEAEAYEFNLPSIGLLKGLGFQVEGVKREAHFDGTEYRSVVVLGLLAAELRRPASAEGAGESGEN